MTLRISTSAKQLKFVIIRDIKKTMDAAAKLILSSGDRTGLKRGLRTGAERDVVQAAEIFKQT